MKKRRRRKNKKLIEESEAPISINEQNKEATTIEKLKLIGYWIIGITVVLSIFSGFKYPWKWIDALYETENEKLEIIAEKWDNAYFPLIEWCGKKTFSSKFLESISKHDVLFFNIETKCVFPEPVGPKMFTILFIHLGQLFMKSYASWLLGET